MTKTNKNNGGAIPPIPKLTQPKAMYLLFFVQMWESFSYYGMRSILVLYMITALDFSDHKAFGIYAIYIALAECLGVFGGRLSDKILGLRYSIYLGGIIIAIGHMILALPIDGYTLYPSLAFIAVGTGLFRTNCTTLLGEFYGENDPRRDAGYTLFYVGLNIGAFLATILCAFTAEKYGWHVGFSLAAIGMILGLLTLLKFSSLLEGKGKKPQHTSKKHVLFVSIAVLALTPVFSILIYHYEIGTYVLLTAIAAMMTMVLQATKTLPKQQKQNISLIMLAIAMLALFYGFEEQVGSSIIVFAERFADKSFFGFEIPVAALSTFNPLTILLLGPLVAIGLARYELKLGKSVNIFSKVALAFALQSIAFAALFLSTNDAKTSSYTIAMSVSIIAFSELFIGPAVYSYCSELAPKHLKGVLMGTVMLGYSLANLLSGFLSQYMAISDENAQYGLSVYSIGFSKIALVCLSASIVIYLIKFILSRRGLK